MKILVFGKTGQVGRALRVAAEMRGIKLDQHGRDTADLSDPAACSDLINATDADAVINAAAWTAVDDAETAEDAAHVINATAPGAMAAAAAARDLPFVHLSTDYVFSGADGDAWKPEDPTGPLGAYGRTKLAGEQAVMSTAAAAVILRTAWVFDGTGKNFVTTMLRLAETRDELSIVSDQIGGPTPADAIADACLTIASALAEGKGTPGIYHFSGTPDVSWADFAREIFARAGKTIKVNGIGTADYPTPAKRPANSRLDCQRLRAVFGIERPSWGAALDSILKEQSS